MSNEVIVTVVPSPNNTVVVSELPVPINTVVVTSPPPPPNTVVVTESPAPSNQVLVATFPVQTVVVVDPASQGPAGVGVPSGGTAGQVLSKVDSSDYNTHWVAAGGGGTGNSYFPGGW